MRAVKNRSRTTIKALLLTVFMIAVLSNSAAQDSLSAASEVVDSGSTDQLSLLLDVDGEHQESVWQWLQSTPTGSRLRARIVNPDTEPYPAHYARLSLERDRIVVGLLMHRDVGERNMLDLWRASFLATYERSQIVVGDYQVNQGLGWTISGTPSWSSTTDAHAALRRPRDGIRMNLSAEEGWGWKGAAVGSTFPSTDGEHKLAQVDLWVGLQAYDALQADGIPVYLPYATQGDHAEDRAVDIVQLPARHAGGHIDVSLPYELGTLGFTGAATEFLENVSPQVSNSRFRFAENQFSATGIAWKLQDASTGFEFHSEFTTQSSSALGGGLVLSSRLSDYTSAVASTWRATKGFSTFHARPTLAFGTDPAGVTGGQLALVHTINQLTVSTGVAADWKEVELSALHPEQRQAVFMRAHTRSFSGTRVDGSVRLRRDIDADLATSDLYTSRLYVSQQLDIFLASLRYNASFEHDGSGHGLTLGAKRRLVPWLEIHTTVAGAIQNGEGARVTLVESHGPGEFPFRTVSTEQISVSARFDLFPFHGMRIWVRGGVARLFESASSSGDTTETLISLGLDWSDYL